MTHNSNSSSSGSMASTTTAANSSCHRDKLHSWFLSLSAQQRSSMLSVEDKHLATLITAMFTKKQQKGGEGFFFQFGNDQHIGSSSNSSRGIATSAASSSHAHHRHSYGSYSNMDTLNIDMQSNRAQRYQQHRPQSARASSVSSPLSQQQQHNDCSADDDSSSNRSSSNSISRDNSLSSMLQMDEDIAFRTTSYIAASNQSTHASVHSYEHNAIDVLCGVQNNCSDSNNASSNGISNESHHHNADKQLEASVRLADTFEYCDTLTIASDALQDGSSFLQLLSSCAPSTAASSNNNSSNSNHSFLSQPCHVEYDSKLKRWRWDVPQW